MLGDIPVYDIPTFRREHHQRTISRNTQEGQEHNALLFSLGEFFSHQSGQSNARPDVVLFGFRSAPPYHS
jgi:G:T-mismatch repair DNA endonuclease (very short patch repair protein)